MKFMISAVFQKRWPSQIPEHNDATRLIPKEPDFSEIADSDSRLCKRLVGAKDDRYQPTS